jgi:hypothetical protein
MSTHVIAENLKPLEFDNDITMGCDPEFFFTDGRGKVVGSEKVLPKKGMDVDAGWGSGGKVIIDGVQAELNPPANTCRALLGNDIHYCFQNLAKKLKADGAKLVLTSSL